MMKRLRLFRSKLVAVFLCAGVVSISSGASGGQEVSVRDLAQRGVDRVRDQMAVATQRGVGTTWATQPGAVSVFSTSGKPMSVYKLYSAPTMVESSVMRLGQDVPADWNEYPGRYVDLNAPRADGDGMQFPIADPRADAEGFSYEQAIAGVVQGRFDAARLPMPVSWLYVLADGNEGYLDSKNRFVGKVAPTEENPIVGRYAFWADDNTSRINVNTASEGVYWDTPRVNTEEDRAYGRFQPAFGEYQRYPGHPAKVSMSSVLYPDRRYRLPGTESGMGVLSLDETKAIWNVARGISDGGSLGGTQVIDTGIKTSIAPLPEMITRYGDPMQITANLPAGAAERVTKGRFFLTSDSRSSETNLLGYPRVGTWPTPNFVTNQTVFDKAIAAIGTVGRQPYYVQRQDAYSRHAEFYNNSAGRNAIVYEYLKVMTDATVPGFGSSFGAKYGTGRFDDRDQILAQSLDYIRGANLFDGTNLGWKYTVGMNRDGAIGHGQTMAYCLCGGSSAHVARWYNPRLQPALGTGRMIGLSEVALMLVLRAETKMPDADGEVAYLGSRSDLEKFGLWDTGKDQAIPGRKLVQMGILVEGFAPAHGFTSLIPRNGIAIGSGVGNDFPDLPDSFTLDFASIKRGRPGNKEYPWATKTTAQRPKDWIAWGGYGGVRLFERMITFEPVVIGANAEAIDFGGATDEDPVRVLLFDSTLDYVQSGIDTGNLVQSYNLAFPRATFPVPEWWAGTDSEATDDWFSFEERMASAIKDGIENLYDPAKDVIQSMVPRHGDYRLVNGRRVVGSETFVPHPEYGRSRMAHSLVDSSGPLPGATFGRELIPGAGYVAAVFPDLPFSPGDQEYLSSDDVLSRGSIDPAVTGDWDSGVGPAPDGAYNNKGDDGDTRGLADDGTPYFDALTETLTASAANAIPERMALPGLMGSLSTGVCSNIPWQTLLFRPAAPGTHFGATGLPDHLWMDLFRLPVVGPMQNSDAFSTDGKVNLNYRIVPFSYIHRSTALHAALKSEKILAVPTNAGATYKTTTTAANWRHHIDAAETLQQWEEKFDRGELFRSSTEICEQYLVPEGVVFSRENMENFWREHALTGDNVKERPYANLNAMLTTKSNSFEVYVIAQTIRKSPDTAPDVFDPALDQVTSEWQGSGHVQRYLDPEDDRITDVANRLSRQNDVASPDELHSVTASLKPLNDVPFEIVDTEYDPIKSLLTLTWNSSPSEIYGIESSDDAELGEWTREDIPVSQKNNRYYRGLRAQGYTTRFTMPVGKNTVAVRVSRL